MAIGFEGIAINAWMVWILPFAGAAIIAGVAKAGHRARDYTAVAFALASAISAATLIPTALAGEEIHSQVPWISSLGINAGVLADPLSIIMANLVAWISFLIMVYSLAVAGAFNVQDFFEVIAWVGAITAFLLATQALVNPEIKKVLAYSTGSQIGYMMMGLGIAGLSLNFVDGYTAGFFQLMSHAMFKASLFMGAGALLHTVGSRFMNDMGGLKIHMKKTYVFMLLAGLSLAGAPLITSGFWSKDAVFAAVLESGYTYSLPLFIMAGVVAVMTAFYTFRMLGMAFFGKESKHIEEMEHKGHHLHEVGPSMWVPFAILAVASIAIGVVGPAFEVQLHNLFAEYLDQSFGIRGEEEGGQPGIPILPEGDRTFFGLNPIAAAASVGAFAVGGALGYVFYIGRKADPQIISRNIGTRAIWKFLYNRWYLNTALYWGGVVGPLAIYRFIWRYFESTIVDGISPAFQQSMAYMSRVVKASQTGITQTYLFVFAAGIMI